MLRSRKRTLALCLRPPGKQLDARIPENVRGRTTVCQLPWPRRGGYGRGRLASGAAAIPGVVPCDQDDDCQHACRDDRFELAAGGGGGTGKDLVRSVCPAGDARCVRRMSATAARIAVSIGAAVARDGHPCALMAIRACPSAIRACPSSGRPCSGAVIREVVIRRASGRGLVAVPAVPGASG